MYYKVNFSGYAILKADDLDEAMEKYEDDRYIMKETKVDTLETAVTMEELKKG